MQQSIWNVIWQQTINFQTADEKTSGEISDVYGSNFDIFTFVEN